MSKPSRGYGAFQNPEVIVCRPGDPRLCFLDYHGDNCITLEKSEYGPGYLVIGKHVGQADIERIARKYNLDPDTILDGI